MPRAAYNCPRACQRAGCSTPPLGSVFHGATAFNQNTASWNTARVMAMWLGYVGAAPDCLGRPRAGQVFDAATSPDAIQRALDAADRDGLSSLAETPAADGEPEGHE